MEVQSSVIIVTTVTKELSQEARLVRRIYTHRPGALGTWVEAPRSWVLSDWSMCPDDPRLILASLGPF